MSKSVDPLGHIKLSVSDSKISKEFYKKIFNELEWKKIDEGNLGAGWASLSGFGFWIKEAEHKIPKYKFSAPGIHHFCFKAKTSVEVDKFYEFLLKEKILILDKPQGYPEYTKDYYAVFFSDPDGIKLELAYY